MALRRYRAWRPEGRGERTVVPLCEACARWLAGLVLESQAGGGRLFGQPGSNGRHLVFDDQCAACCESPTERALALRWLHGGAPAGELFLCLPCGGWLIGLASSGRTARGQHERHLDGRYGTWPHPRLRGLRIWSRVRDSGAARVIEAAAAVLGLGEADHAGEADVIFVEATPSGAARASCRQLGPKARSVVVMAAMGSRQDLAGALVAGAGGWVTVPCTPQQVSAAVARAATRDDPPPWDPATCLPVLAPASLTRPWLWFPFDNGADAWTLAWLVRRFTRGYDAVGAAPGGVILVPVVPGAAIGRLADRLQGTLGRGVRIEPRLPGETMAPRFEATG